jgi:three-Cys-motif partner protein
LCSSLRLQTLIYFDPFCGCSQASPQGIVPGTAITVIEAAINHSMPGAPITGWQLLVFLGDADPKVVEATRKEILDKFGRSTDDNNDESIFRLQHAQDFGKIEVHLYNVPSVDLGEKLIECANANAINFRGAGLYCFADPWGWKDIPKDLFSNLRANFSCCDLLINLMSRDINRFRKVPNRAPSLKNLTQTKEQQAEAEAAAEAAGEDHGADSDDDESDEAEDEDDHNNEGEQRGVLVPFNSDELDAMTPAARHEAICTEYSLGVGRHNDKTTRMSVRCGQNRHVYHLLFLTRAPTVRTTFVLWQPTNHSPALNLQACEQMKKSFWKQVTAWDPDLRVIAFSERDDDNKVTTEERGAWQEELIRRWVCPSPRSPYT